MILFLDFDGVLHPDCAFLEKGRPVLRCEGALFMWSRYLEDTLAPYPQVNIVISSSWCRVFGYSRAKKSLPAALQPYVIGGTWHSAMARSMHGGFKLPVTWWDSVTRYEQIREYVRRARLEHWVAIDDNNEGWAEDDADRLILTDPSRGLSDPHALDRLREKLASI